MVYGSMSCSSCSSSDAVYFMPYSTASSLGLTGSSLLATFSQSAVVGANSSTSVASATPNQPSPEFLATVVQAVKQALVAKQAPVLQANRPGTSGLADCAVTSSMTSCSLGGVFSKTLGLQALALHTMGSGFPSQLSVA